MKKNWLLKIGMFLLIVNTSCKKDQMLDCFKSTGPIESEDRTVTENFNVIEVNNNINLILTDDTVASIKVEAGNNLLSEITTDIADGKLTLKNNNKCNWVRKFNVPINVYVHAHPIDKILGYNTGDITSTNAIKNNIFNFEGWSSGHFDLTVDCQELDCSLNVDVCDAVVHGHADNCFLWTAGNGFFHNEDLTTTNTFLTTKSTGDTYVNAANILSVKILGEGNVYFTGNPIITQTISGKGKLIKQ